MSKKSTPGPSYRSLKEKLGQNCPIWDGPEFDNTELSSFILGLSQLFYLCKFEDPKRQ